MDRMKPFKVKEYRGQPVRWIEEKADGYSVEVYRSGSLEVITRGGHDIAEMLTSLHQILHTLPDGTRFRAELHAPGVPATSVPTLINDQSERLIITPFYNPDVLAHQDFVDWARRYRMEPPGWTEEVPDEVESLKKEALDRGLEGFILVEDYHGQRYKVKPTKTVDCVVMEAEQSFSETWWPGLKCLHVGVYCADNLKKIARVGSGFAGEYRLSIDTQGKRDALEGRVCEVEYDSVAAKGQLKFPRFVRWRDDKRPEECTDEQL